MRLLSFVSMAVWLVGCGQQPPASRASPEASPASPGDDLTSLVARSPTADWHYDVVGRPGGELVVEASIRDAASGELSVDNPAWRYVRDLEVKVRDGWNAVEDFEAPTCRRRCRIRYRFDLQSAADEVGDTEVAARHDATILSPPTAWLLRPSDDDASLVFRVRPERSAFVTGLWPLENEPDTYVGDARVFWRAPYSAFGAFRTHRRNIGGARVEIAIAEGSGPLNEGVVLRWLDDGMRALTTYFGQFPVPRALFILLPTSGTRVRGKELGGGGASVLLWVGRDATASKLARDWVGVHEMVHLSHPMMPYRYGWLAEGLATYVEPLARAQAGLISPEIVWRDMVRGMPNGQPGPGDRGLDRTRTWGRLYWGGAMFALMADVAIRRRTGGNKSLQDALRAVVARGGHNGSSWSMEKFVATCDEATGTKVVSDLYRAWSRAPVTVDLAGLWRELGVTVQGRSVTFDDDAPLAAVRKSMTSPPRSQ